MRHVRGSTMVELLVMLIVSVLVFIAVTDGIVMFRKYTMSISRRITHNSDFYDSYYRLAELAESSDSVCYYGEMVIFYSQGELRSAIYEKDSVLIVTVGEVVDTLFSHVVEMKFEMDTLSFAVLKSDDEVFRFRFATTQSKSIAEQKQFEQQEKEYRYE